MNYGDILNRTSHNVLSFEDVPSEKVVVLVDNTL